MDRALEWGAGPEHPPEYSIFTVRSRQSRSSLSATGWGVKIDQIVEARGEPSHDPR